MSGARGSWFLRAMAANCASEGYTQFSLSLRGMEETSREVENDSGARVALLLVLVGCDADSDDRVSEE